MKEQEIIYSSSNLKKLREKDPELKAMADQWEQAFKSKVQVYPTDQGGIRVKPIKT